MKHSWARVRALGELRVLTRASYVSLVLVPFVSGLWPAIQVAVNRYNHAINEASDRFETATQLLRNVSAETKSDRLEAATNRAVKSVDQWNKKFSELTVTEPDLPRSLALTFYAAMFVVLGHFAYEAKAPIIVRQGTKGDFIAKRQREFWEDAPDLKNQLQRSQGFIRQNLPYDPSLKQVDNHVLVLQHGQEYDIPLHDKNINELWTKPDATLGNPERDSGNVGRMRVLIERGAQAEYEVGAREEFVTSWVAALSYLASMILLMWIIALQGLAIWKNAGFWGST